jgi:aminoglycoside 6'-N-acetyltransferase I
VTIRQATDGDVATLIALGEAFEREVPELPHREGWEDAADDVRHFVSNQLALLAEEEGEPIGFALARTEPPRVCYLSDLYVVPEARRRGVAKALMAEVARWGAERGAETLTLEVLTSNAEARAVYDRLGFLEESRILYAPLETLAQRVARRERAASFGSIHVQTDDVDAVVKSVEIYVPRLPGRSAGSVVSQPRDGWVAVYDELCDREPEMLRRLALSLSDRTGAVILLLGVEEGAVVRYALLERGRVLDEYLSVPEYYGPLPPGDVVGLGANPTVAQRLTGADPARVRAVARVARSPADLPPARELAAQIGSLFGVTGVDYGFAEARELPGAVVLDRV